MNAGTVIAARYADDISFANCYAADGLWNGIRMQGSAAATPRWWQDPPCSQTDPDAFITEDGVYPETVRNICRACPVRVQCLDDAMITDDVDYGIRAALTPHQRRTIRRTMNHQPGKEAAA
jgi:WhiB family redox-sensing transcriptional regulator